MCFGYSLLVRKMNVGNKKFEAICAYCGNSTTVPFKPDGERNVYCRENQDCRTKDTEYRKMNPNIYDKFKKKMNPLKPAEEPVAEEPKSDDKQDIIKKLEEDLEKHKYTIAELQNTLRHHSRDLEQTRKSANLQIIQNIIKIFEDLNITYENSNLDDSSKEGLTMVLKNFKSLLTEQSVEFIHAEGNSFDHNIHEAVGQTENSNYDDNVVIQEIQRGYKIHGEVVRPSKVVVNKKTVSSSVDVNE